MNEEKLIFEAEKVKLSSNIFKDFVVCTAYLMSDGVNRNLSEFTLESLENSLDTFINKPVLANVWRKREINGQEVSYVGGHDSDIVTDSDGETYVTYRDGERPVGVITDLSNIKIKKYKGKNFVVAKLFLWKQYNPELIKILAKDKNKKVSVEIVATEYDTYIKDDVEIKRIKKFDFLGVTILGHAEGRFGKVREIEEGIEHSHLELEEESLDNFVLAYSKAFDDEVKQSNVDKYFKDIREIPDTRRNEIIYQEICEENELKELSYLSSSALEGSTFEGHYICDKGIYRYKGELNCDETFELTEVSNIEDWENKDKKYYTYFKNKANKFNNNVVNLSDSLEIDERQLIYKIFTYCNSEEIVKLLFGTIEKGWEENPFRHLRQPFATIRGEDIVFSRNDLSRLSKDRLQTLYEDLKSDSSFYEIESVVKELIEKYETGESQEMKENNLETEVIENSVEEVENVTEVKDCIPTLETESCTPTENESEAPASEEEVETEGCGEEKMEEGCDKEPDTNECDTEECGDVEKEECGDKDKEEMSEEEPQEETCSKAEFDALKEQYDTLKEEFEKLKLDYTSLENAKNEREEEISKMKFDAFMNGVEEELANSDLSDKNKENIREMAKNSKFESITDVQKEIAFAEKQNKKETYTFSNTIVNEVEEKNLTVFGRLRDIVKNK